MSAFPGAALAVLFEPRIPSSLDLGVCQREASRRAREAKAEWQRTRVYGKEDARKPLTDAVQGFYLMYSRQKGEKLQPDSKFYINYTNLAYFAAFDNYVMNMKLPDDFRDRLSQAELKHLAIMETRIRLLVNRQTGMDTPYSEAYQAIKKEIDVYANEHGRITCHALPLMLEDS
jgi:hypothetical protein